VASDIDFTSTAWKAVEQFAMECVGEWTVEALTPGTDAIQTEFLRGKIAAFQQLIDLPGSNNHPRTKPFI